MNVDAILIIVNDVNYYEGISEIIAYCIAVYVFIEKS